MRIKRTLFAAGALALLPALLPAQAEELSGHPGFFDLDALEIVADEDIEIEVNLTGPMMGLIAGVTQKEDPEFASLIRGLKRIRVRLGTPSETDEDGISQRLATAARQLDESGWSPMVRVRDGDDRVYVYAREIDETIQGMTVLVRDGDEVAMVNIVGEVDLPAMGRLISNMDALEGLGTLWGKGE